MSKHPNCPFCGEPEFIIENELAFADYDSYPVSAGHCLVVPRRHIAEYFDVTAAEKAAIWELVDQVKGRIDREFSPDGYNIGVNVGAAAGQSIPHVHIHVIPRYAGDVENAQGGVRGVIPHKHKYVRKTGSE
jgi:diadenosine tetraphosphate (Ap4A) HIT family hydrolase